MKISQGLKCQAWLFNNRVDLEGASFNASNMSETWTTMLIIYFDHILLSSDVVYLTNIVIMRFINELIRPNGHDYATSNNKLIWLK